MQTKQQQKRFNRLFISERKRERGLMFVFDDFLLVERYLGAKKSKQHKKSYSSTVLSLSLRLCLILVNLSLFLYAKIYIDVNIYKQHKIPRESPSILKQLAARNTHTQIS